MTATPAVDEELSSRAKEVSKRRLSFGRTEEHPDAAEGHHPGSSV
jgi:hypothetical protein